MPDVDLTRLLTDEEHNRTGSFAWPPAARSAEQVVDFWMRVAVPDDVMRQVYEANRRAVKASLAVAHHPLRPDPSAEVPAIPRVDLGLVVRLAKAAGQAVELSPEERARFFETYFVFPSGRRMTPAEMVAGYRLSDIEAAFVSSDGAAALRHMVSELLTATRQLDQTVQSLIATTEAGTGEVVRQMAAAAEWHAKALVRSLGR